MKVGEIWIRKDNGLGFGDDNIRGGIVRITRVYYFDLDNQDYVEYDIINEHVLFADKYSVIAAGIERNKFLQIFEKSHDNIEMFERSQDESWRDLDTKES